MLEGSCELNGGGCWGLAGSAADSSAGRACAGGLRSDASRSSSDYIVGDDIEGNQADYGMKMTDSFDLTFVNNSARDIDVTSDYSTQRHVSFNPTALTGNKVDQDLYMFNSNNITAKNNAGASACARCAPAHSAGSSLTPALCCAAFQ